MIDLGIKQPNTKGGFLEKIQKLSDAWKSAKDSYIDAENEARLKAFFGSDYEYQLLHNISEQIPNNHN